jgi:hypothetical protein
MLCYTSLFKTKAPEEFPTATIATAHNVTAIGFFKRDMFILIFHFAMVLELIS